MAEDIRRSGRANKGHHSKTQDALDEPVVATKSKTTKPKGDKKAQSQAPAPAQTQTQTQDESRAGSEQSGDQDGEDDAIIRCVCGDQRDIRGRQMICCDQCEAWQHVKCLGLQEGDHWDAEDATYHCEVCRPEDHGELLAAMSRGEKPWARKKGSKPKARPSDVRQDSAPEKTKTPQQSPPLAADPTPVEAPSPSPAPVTAEVRNGHSEPKIKKEAPKSQPQSPVGEKRRHDDTAEKANASKKRRRSSQHQDKTTAQPSEIVDIDALPEMQKTLAGKLRDILIPLIKSASDARGYRIPDGETATSLAARFSLHIALASLEQFGEPTGAASPYSDRFRAIMFNVKKNSLLVDRLLSGSLKAQELATMPTEEMASEDAQRQYAAMREAAEKQMILTEETGPRLRKTHKGEEVVDDDNANDNTEFRQPQLRERESISDDHPLPPLPYDRPADSPADAGSVDMSNAQPDLVRRPSTNFDINSVFDKVRSPQNDQHSFLHRRRSSMRQEKPQGPVDDADVDRLLKDEDNDVEMSGYSADPTVCWQGTIGMQSQSAEAFDAVARFVAGGDFGQVIPWEKLISKSLSIQGRIEGVKGNDYIRTIGTSESHDVAILAVSPTTPDARDKMDNLYTYFHERAKWGVVPVDNLGNDVMRDLYVIPVEAGPSNLPSFIDMLDYCTIETPRKEHLMLLVLVAKLPEDKPPLIAQTMHFDMPVAQMLPANAPSPSPVAAMQYSPMFAPNPHTNTNTPQQQQGAYGNPFATNSGAAPAPSMLPQLSPPPPPHHLIPQAREILGPFIDAPVIIQILGNSIALNQAVSVTQMENLRHILEKVPEARADVGVLSGHLRGRGE
ncbi:hypothetical protein P153DRAFT_426761 [Dothidotthia symphoricarpi CBS 119687]|uniref:Transcription factor BYE1 n=1 Tax=Dothidotthia symphoricarpi CBS 119687 TaxID=1392245 RepID=A0A6A5ZYK7_9PLEO|nr:uncharacterized protein P153DRAFT_426761 [Dothidotthia symphoricarpi CBS 119687]KAF2123867.1 hypothetical protein P153DRAFT_426761 [Dothidotthia symphoricarpi CBS 119687]